MASKNKKEIKPIPVVLALLMVLAAFGAMALFVRYLIAPGSSNADGVSSEISVDEQSFEDETSVEPPPPVNVEVKDHMSDANVGDVVKFGTYDQNANTDDGKEPIEWVVLEKQEDKLLLISRYALDCKPYNETRTPVEWKNSTLCGWLNGTFAEEAFSEEEYASVVVNNEVEKVFILSSEESSKYYEYDSWRTVAATETAVSNGARVQDGACWYWLSNTADGYAKYVYFNGAIARQTFAVDSNDVAVRPAIWVSANTETDLDTSSEISE